MCISNVTKIKNIQNIQVMANQNKTDIGLIGFPAEPLFRSGLSAWL